MGKKLPYFPFYPGDWLKDDALALCAPATRGIWIDLIARMHERDRSGELRGTAEQLARAARCSSVEFVHAATELKDTNTADVERRNEMYTVRNRRMFAESQAKKAAAERQSRFRNTKVTPLYEGEYETEFEEFWKSFPSGRKKSKGTAREAFAKAAAKCEPAKIIAAAAEYAASEAGRGQFVKMPATWLNQECWADDRASWRDTPNERPAVKEYRTITPEEFKNHKDSDNFLTRPLQDNKNPCRWFGQLRNGTKVETFTKPKTT